MHTINVRTTCPKESDKYAKCYRTQSTGGWSGCIKGKPTQPYCNVLANCVGHASARFNEIYDELTGKTGNKYQLVSNAENFIEHAKAMGLEIGMTPRPGAIGVLQKGATLNGSDGAGHVFICEYPMDLNPDNYKIYTSESGYNSTAFWNAVRSNANGRYGSGSAYKFRGFIYNPAVNYYKPEIVARDTNVNQIRTVKAMNVRLGIETNTESIAYVPVGTIFNYYATKNGKSSIWYAVSKDQTQWVAGASLAGDKKYVEVLPANQPAPTPVQKFKIGDKVTVNGKIYVSSNATKASGVLRNKKTTITRYSKTGKHPYNFTGDIGWADESSLTKR